MHFSEIFLKPKPWRTDEQTQRSSTFFPTPNTFPRWPLQPPYALWPRWVKRPGDLDLWHFDLESGVWVTCDVGYLCANFGLLRPLCSRVRPDVRDRQTSDKSIA